MKTPLILIAFLAIIVAAEITPKVANVKYADRNFLMKQKFLLDVVDHIHQPLRQPEYLADVGSYVNDSTLYKNYETVSQFFTDFQRAALPKNYLFTVFNPKHLKQAKGLFYVFYYSNDWQTFYKNVLWARQNVNEGVFVYALTLAVVHRPDMAGIILPAPYEICPYMFYTTDVLTQVKNVDLSAIAQNVNEYTVLANYTDKYMAMNKEWNLAYFTEDIGWNSYNYYFHIDYPFWMGGKEFNLFKDRRGELYLYVHQQILARYFMERLSQNLGNIPIFSWLKPIKTGYNPHMRYYNGLDFSVRKNYYDVMLSANYEVIDTVQDYERRIRDIIDMGYFILSTGEKIDLRQPENIEFLGNVIQANPDSVDRDFVDYMTLLAITLLRGDTTTTPTVGEKYSPSVLEHFETAMRDPIFYQLYNRVMGYYSTFKDYLDPYNYGDLLLPGVTVLNVTTTRLVTYYDYFDADISNAADVPVTHTEFYPAATPYQTQKQFTVYAKQKRLNHRPFTVTFDVLSDQPRKVVVRLYMAPTLDRHRIPFTLADNRDNFVQLDQFIYDLPVGQVTIKRNSQDFYWSVKDRTTYSELYQKVLQGLDGTVPFPLDQSEAHCGFPDRLVLPKGWVSGFPMKFFVIITPYDETAAQKTYDPTISCGIGSGNRYIDNLPFGFPFDRAVDEAAFTTPNLFFKDVAVYFMPEGMLANVADLNPRWAWKLENVLFSNKVNPTPVEE